ncbi:uncharacterized protein LOC112558801 isoform X2 [Pomacea canaliculata]|uniref:uncharacterized protein LOC112558801 isoform X2 n=1 Tax=Pomacea canaliculata TaxID=400727 RepID=UPI000D727791|nr:uncharacterized protein LOC112558801 isoform X2 [Pomacea canaliculata]
MSHTDLDDVDATPSGVSLETTITFLPDLVLSGIFQYLYWKEKIMAVEAFPAWSRILDSSLGWKHFENDRSYAHSFKALMSPNYLFEEITCIAQYGQFFIHGVIWLQKFLPTDNPEETDFALLGALETHCFRLKSLAIYHPPNLSSSSIILSFVPYIQPLQKMFSFSPSLKLSFYRLLYSSVEAHTGALDLLHFYLTHNVLQKVACLDFSHGLILASSVHPLNYLVYCMSLRVLKCPIQNLNTLILQQLVEFSLQELYLTSDEHTLTLNYVEKSAIDWHALQLIPGRKLKVHYVFKNRSVYPVHMCPNPYARSLVFDSLCSSISRALLLSVADMYGATLEHVAFILAIWDPLVPFSDLEDLPTNIQYMASRLKCVQTVLLNLVIPKDALITLAQHAPALKTLLVYEHKIFFGRHAVNTVEEIEELKSIISEALGYSWKPVKQDDTLYKLSCYRQNLLFEDNVCQSEGFW